MLKKIIFTASECVPFVKTGGLGDVVGALPKYIDKTKYDVRIILPKYKFIPQNLSSEFEFIQSFEMNLGWRNQYVGVFKTIHDNITFYFLDNEFYFSGFYPYSDMNWDVEKFAFFSKAILSILPIIDFKPDIIHCNDWQTGLVSVFLDAFFKHDKFYSKIKTIMTIHNLKFQGKWDLNTIKDITGLPEKYFTEDKLQDGENGNYLKGGIVFSDIVTTVSKTYADEIKIPFYGEGLDGLIRKKGNSLLGIINGIDYDEFDPKNDKYIECKYSLENYKVNKYKNKLALQKELGLNQDPDVFMFGLVTRLTDQKGLDLIQFIMDKLCTENLQFVVLGTGDVKYENFFKHYAWKFKETISANILYSEELAHKIYAASDSFLMPSMFEPCGLSQLISLRYGCVPIVRETGGLKDTVEPYNEYKLIGTGFSFENYNGEELYGIIQKAINIFYNKKKQWQKIMENGMQADFSWNSSAKEYESVYESL